MPFNSFAIAFALLVCVAIWGWLFSPFRREDPLPDTLEEFAELYPDVMESDGDEITMFYAALEADKSSRGR
ncbi:hypothetical protein [Rhodococcoides corynebacterioides]|uniref:hypothetical protein n=1 Tax=Rhodococcoides corynebacterioides TaxID=53972 RepID=UPI003ADA741E